MILVHVVKARAVKQYVLRTIFNNVAVLSVHIHVHIQYGRMMVVSVDTRAERGRLSHCVTASPTLQPRDPSPTSWSIYPRVFTLVLSDVSDQC